MFTTILYGFDVYWLKTSQQSQHLFLLHISMTFTLPLTLKTFLFSDAMYLLKYRLLPKIVEEDKCPD